MKKTLEAMKTDISILKLHLSNMTVTGEGSIPLALCIQSVQRISANIDVLAEMVKPEEKTEEEPEKGGAENGG